MCPALSATSIINNMHYVKFKSHNTSESLGKLCIIRVQQILESTNHNIVGQIFPEVWKSKTMYNMIPYKSKVMHTEYDILFFFLLDRK